MRTIPQSCEQFLSDFAVALDDLNAYANRSPNNSISEPHGRELIASFETTHELALNVISAYLATMGKGPFSGSRDATVEAFHAELIDDGKTWLDMIIDRIQYNPIYAMDTQQKFLDNIKHRYLPLFVKFENNMSKRLEE